MTVIEEIKDFADNVKKGVGDKGFYILIAAALGFGLYNLLKKDNSSEYVSATGYASYPTAPENADMIVDSINNELWASHDELVGAIETSESEIIQNMDDQFDNTNQKIDDVNQNINEQFEATNNYINEGIASQQQIIETIEDTRQEPIYVSIPDPIAVSAAVTSPISPASSVALLGVMGYGTPTGKTYAVSNNTKSSSGSTKSSSSKSSSKKTTTTKNPTSTKASTSTKKTTSTTSPATYNYTTKKGLNTSTSIVDALKATGANSSMSARKEIAKANGISNYTGTTKQNTQMLNMMKSGDLVKPSATKSSSSKSSSSKSRSSKSSSKKK